MFRAVIFDRIKSHTVGFVIRQISRKTESIAACQLQLAAANSPVGTGTAEAQGGIVQTGNKIIICPTAAIPVQLGFAAKQNSTFIGVNCIGVVGNSALSSFSIDLDRIACFRA